MSVEQDLRAELAATRRDLLEAEAQTENQQRIIAALAHEVQSTQLQQMDEAIGRALALIRDWHSYARIERDVEELLHQAGVHFDLIEEALENYTED